MKKILTPLFCLFLAIGSFPNLHAQLGPDTATVETGNFVKFDVRGNDPASSLTWPLCDGAWQPPSFTSNAGGSWVIMPGDSIRYLPPHGFVGEDWFLYAICNPNTNYQIDTGRVTIYVTATDSVWPGDANSDGVANNQDLLQLGLGFGYVGSARDSVSNTWEAKFSTDYFWPNFASGLSYKHLDCNGDSLIEWADTVAINQNYGLIHLRLDGTEKTGPLLSLEFLEDTLVVGDTATIIVNLGTDTLPASNLHGIAFTANYDTSLVDANSIEVHYDNSWIATAGVDLLTIDKNFPQSGKIDMGLSRIDQQNVNGFGEIARIKVIMIDDLTAKADLAEMLSFELSNVFAISADASELDFSTQGDSVVVFQEDTTSTTAIRTDWHQQIKVYPNPAQDRLEIELANLQAQRVQLLDMRGSVLRSSSPNTNRLQWDVRDLARGMYLLQIETKAGRYQQKILIQ
ncbi:MAG: T9SS type A sorting domain-containing protein [Bacteroidota bacterium]